MIYGDPVFVVESLRANLDHPCSPEFGEWEVRSVFDNPVKADEERIRLLSKGDSDARIRRFLLGVGEALARESTGSE